MRRGRVTTASARHFRCPHCPERPGARGRVQSAVSADLHLEEKGTEVSRTHHTTAGAAAVLALLTVGLTTGCGAVDKTMGCVRAANTISTSVNDLQKAVDSAAKDPAQAERALAEIDKNLATVADTSKDADVSKATDDLKKAVADVSDAVRGGNPSPDITPVKTAAGDLAKVCSP